MADYEEMHHGSITECLLFLFFSPAMVRNDFCITVQLWRPCWIEIILKNNVVIRMKTKNNNIPYMPLLEG